MDIATSPLPGLKLLLQGPTGTGKTSAIASWLDAGITPYCIFTEPSYEVLGDAKFGNALSKIHWRYIPPANPEFDEMIDSARKLNTLSNELLAKMGDINKQHYSQFMDVLVQCNNFKCQRTDKSFGSIDKWKTNRVVVIDSLSGLNVMAMNLIVGSKPIKSLPDWGVAMDNLERLLQKLCTGLHCHFMLIAHVEPERDESTGATKIMASTLGRKLAPKISRYFSDVVLSHRDGGNFSWSTADTNTDLKARNVPIASNLRPYAKQLIESWQSHGGIIEKEVELASQPIAA